MGIFSKLFSKKCADVELKVLSPKKTGLLGEAENIANIVSEGLNTENYLGMSKKLSSLPVKEHTDYVFKHHRIGGVKVARWCCIFTLLVFAYYCIIGVFTAILSDEYRVLGIVISAMSLGLIFANFKFIKRFESRIKFKKRYDAYFGYLGLKKVEYVRDFAIAVNVDESIVAGDFERAINEKLIPQGRLILGKRIFMLSDSMYERYTEQSEEYDLFFAKKILERDEEKLRSENGQMLFEKGEQFFLKLKEFKTLVKDNQILKLIEKIEKNVWKIFYEIDVNITESRDLVEFVDYYLPTIEILLDTYIGVCEKRITVPNQGETKNILKSSFSVVNVAFEDIIERIFEAQIQKAESF